MQRFFIHIRDGLEYTRDHEGTEQSDLASACQGARALIAAEIEAGADTVDIHICIEDARGIPLAVLPVSAKVVGLG